MLDSFDELRDSLPSDFYAKFTDVKESNQARLIEAWAVSRGLQFASKSPGSPLPTWFVVLAVPGGFEPILTMQTSRTITNQKGRAQKQGVSDIPFHRQTSPFLRQVSNRLHLLGLLHSTLPQGKPLDPGDAEAYWPFTWKALAESNTPGAFIAALDWAVSGASA